MDLEKIIESTFTVVGEHVTDAVILCVTKSELTKNSYIRVTRENAGIMEVVKDVRVGVYDADNAQKKVHTIFEIKEGFKLDGSRDKGDIYKVTRLSNDNKTDYDISFGVKRDLGGGGPNLIKTLYAIGIEHKVNYVAIHPQGSELPHFDDKVEKRLIYGNAEDLGEFQNLVFRDIKDITERNKRICKHPKNKDFRIEEEGKEIIKNALGRGIVILNSIGYKNLSDAVIDQYIENNRTEKDYNVGIIALTNKFENEKGTTRNPIREKALAAGFIPILNESELKYHTGVDCGFEDSLDYARVLQAVQILRAEQLGNHQRIYVTLGSRGGICVDKNGEIHWTGIYRPGVKPKNTNGGGDAYAAGISEMEYQNHFVRDEQNQVGIEEAMKLATAAARCKIDEELSKESLNKLVTEGNLQYTKLEKNLGQYIKEITENGFEEINNELRRLCCDKHIDYFLQPGVRGYCAERAEAIKSALKNVSVEGV